MQCNIQSTVTYTKLLNPFSKSWHKIEPGDWTLHPGSLNSTDVEFTTPFVQWPGDMHLYTAIRQMYFYMSVREQRRPPASSPIIMHEYALPESSASPRDLSPLVSGTDLIVTILASSTMDQNITDAALSSPYDVKSCW